MNVQAVRKIGFEKIHQKGSHVRYRYQDGRLTVVPVHENEELGRGLLREILNQIKLEREEYDKLRREV